jgi:hypothetical protein
MDFDDWLSIVAAVILIPILAAMALVAVLVLAGVAYAAPPAGADLSMRPWYESLIDPKTGGSCCGEGDCRHYPTSTYTDPLGKTHYQVKFRDVWMAVPDDRILERTDNPTGDIVTCIYPDAFQEKPSPFVMCLIKAPGT